MLASHTTNVQGALPLTLSSGRSPSHSISGGLWGLFDHGLQEKTPLKEFSPLFYLVLCCAFQLETPQLSLMHPWLLLNYSL